MTLELSKAGSSMSIMFGMKKIPYGLDMLQIRVSSESPKTCDLRTPLKLDFVPKTVPPSKHIAQCLQTL